MLGGSWGLPPRSMMSHLILRLGHWPLSEVFEPQCQMEDAIEMFFGQMKTVRRDVKGSCTIGNSIGACHMVHSKQRRRPAKAWSTLENYGKLGIDSSWVCHNLVWYIAVIIVHVFHCNSEYMFNVF